MAGASLKWDSIHIHQSWIPFLPPFLDINGSLMPQFSDVNWNHWNTGATIRMLHTSFGNLNSTSRDTNIHSAQYSNDMIFLFTPYHQVSTVFFFLMTYNGYFTGFRVVAVIIAHSKMTILYLLMIDTNYAISIIFDELVTQLYPTDRRRSWRIGERLTWNVLLDTGRRMFDQWIRSISLQSIIVSLKSGKNGCPPPRMPGRRGLRYVII